MTTTATITIFNTMAVLGRDDIQQNTNDKLPTNNAKLITAAKHREVLKDFRESFFNLVDDTLANITYEVQGGNNVTLGDYLSNLFQNSVKRIKVGQFDVGGSDPGDVLTVNDPNGLVSSAVVIDSDQSDILIKIDWTGNSGISTSNAKIPVVHYVGQDWNKNNDVGGPLIQDNGSYINVTMGEYRSKGQLLELEIIIL